MNVPAGTPPVAAVAVPRGRGLARAGGRVALVPGRLPLIEPMLAALARYVPASTDDWAAEAKWDGALH
jgi:ATP-dependent DNA ligase